MIMRYFTALYLYTSDQSCSLIYTGAFKSADWAANAVRWAANTGVTSGTLQRHPSHTG